MARSDHDKSRRLKRVTKPRRQRHDFTRSIARGDFDALAPFLPSRRAI